MEDELTLLLEIFNKIKKADKLLCLLRLMLARPRLSLRLQPPLLLQLGQLQHQVGVVIVTAVHEQGLAAFCVQLLTRLPWQKQQPPVLH